MVQELELSVPTKHQPRILIALPRELELRKCLRDSFPNGWLPFSPSWGLPMRVLYLQTWCFPYLKKHSGMIGQTMHSQFVDSELPTSRARSTSVVNQTIQSTPGAKKGTIPILLQPPSSEALSLSTFEKFLWHPCQAMERDTIVIINPSLEVPKWSKWRPWPAHSWRLGLLTGDASRLEIVQQLLYIDGIHLALEPGFYQGMSQKVLWIKLFFLKVVSCWDDPVKHSRTRSNNHIRNFQHFPKKMIFRRNHSERSHGFVNPFDAFHPQGVRRLRTHFTKPRGSPQRVTREGLEGPGFMALPSTPPWLEAYSQAYSQA